MNNERRKKLMETVKKFNKTHKSEVFSMGSEIEELPVISSGIKTIDKFIGGGFKQGGHTIIWGPFSSGKTALVLHTIANAQKQDKLVCYVNTEKPIEPERFKFFGINLDDMLYIEAPENAEKALEAIRTLCKEKVIDLFIIDSLNGLCPKSVDEEKAGKERSLEKKNVASLALTLSNFYQIVNAHVFRSRASVIWIGQARTQGIGTFFTRMGLSGGNAQEFYAYQIISVRRGQNSDSPVSKFKRYYIDKDNKIRYKTEDDVIGFDVVLKLEKTNSCKSAKEKSDIHVPFLYEKGFVDEVIESEEIPVTIGGESMTEEKIKMVRKELIKKGILQEKCEDDVMSEINPNPPNVEQKPFTEEQSKALDEATEKPKKRGRPKKKKE